MEELNHDLQPLDPDAIRKKLKNFPGWEYKDDKISKNFEFESFSNGIEFVCRLAPFCNNLDHHPDVYISYKKFTFYLTRFSIGGKVTERDFTIAEKIEELYRKMY